MTRSMGFTRDAERFADLDRAALHNALLALHTCPNCRRYLIPVAFCGDTYGCCHCHETWHIPTEAHNV